MPTTPTRSTRLEPWADDALTAEVARRGYPWDMSKVIGALVEAGLRRAGYSEASAAARAQQRPPAKPRDDAAPGGGAVPPAPRGPDLLTDVVSTDQLDPPGRPPALVFSAWRVGVKGTWTWCLAEPDGRPAFGPQVGEKDRAACWRHAEAKATQLGRLIVDTVEGAATGG